MAKLDKEIAVMAAAKMRNAGSDDRVRDRLAPRHPQTPVVEKRAAAAFRGVKLVGAGL
jgi:hypothetical protein